VRIPFAGSEHQESRKDVYIYMSLSALCGLLRNQPIEYAIAQCCLLRYPNSYRTVSPAAKPHGVIKVPS